MKPQLVILRLLLLLSLPGALFSFAGCQQRPNPENATDQIRTPHFLDSFPLHNETLSQTPNIVKINFDFDLGKQSKISVSKNGSPVTSGATRIGANALYMEVPLKQSGDGNYRVTYRAFWPDGSYHDGRFQFTVSASALSGYVDMTGRPEVTISMKALRFDPARLIVSRGAKVTWVNNDSVLHFVNSDPHASHNVIDDFNSRSLQTGASYSFTFNETGEWGYHCSAHFGAKMTGRVIVKDPPVTSPAETPPSAIENLRTPHFVESMPAHLQILPAVPGEVVLTFNFDLDHSSSIKITQGGMSVAGPTVFSDDNLTMRAAITGTQTKGTYVVNYTAYWPDKTFHDGQFAFSVE
jgi:plastocyanin